MTKSNQASYASDSAKSRGRLHKEADSATRSAFSRDRDRIIHSTAFRRLGHKTQVFVSPSGDHIRTRLTHSLEVAQIARALARQLALDEDLTEAIALAHDLGHPPFGHSGEEALDEAMQPWGGFGHNDHALRILTRLETRYPGFPGLNLCYETLDGLIKHNGPPGALTASSKNLPATLLELCSSFPGVFDLGQQASLEAQAAAIADDIAYSHHDLDDGVRAGLFTLDEIAVQVPGMASVIQAAEQKIDAGASCPIEERKALVLAETIRQSIGDTIADVLQVTRANLAAGEIRTLADVQRSKQALVCFSPARQDFISRLKSFLMVRMYRSIIVIPEREEGKRVIRHLFDRFKNNPQLLPEGWLSAQIGADVQEKETWTARRIADYIAGMTDRFAQRLYKAD